MYRALMIAVLLGLTIASDKQAQGATRVVTITGRIVSQCGWPHGGTYFVLSGKRLAELHSGRTDNLGEISCRVEVPRDVRSVVVLVFSEGMIRNTLDEWVDDAGKRTSERNRGTQPRLLRYIVFGRCEPPVEGLREYVLRFGRNHTRVADLALHRTVGQMRVDSVAKACKIARNGRVDCGTIELPRQYALVELTLRLRSEDGRRFRQPVILGGFDPLRGGARLVYLYMTLAQRGDTVRILLARGAARLLMHSPHRFLVLASQAPPGPGANHLPCLIRLPDDALKRLKEYDARISADVIVPTSSADLAKQIRKSPRSPELWQYGEQVLL